MSRASTTGFRFLSAFALISLAASGPAVAQGFSQPGQAPGGGVEAPPPAYPPAGGMSHLPIPPPAPDFNLPATGAPGAGMPPAGGAAFGTPPPAGGAALGEPPPGGSEFNAPGGAGFGAPPSGGIGFGAPPNQPNQPARPNYADELTDFGVPPQSTLQVNVASETPLTIPGGHVITTNEMRQAVGSDILFFDVWQAPPHPTIPGAIALPGAGSPGSFNDNVQRQLWAVLAQLTNRQPQLPIVFFCTGSRCWESYNAALRALAMGFKVVLWYRGGLSAWQAAGQPTAAPRQSAGSTQQ